MKGLTLFYLEHCPYCQAAKRALEAIAAENPDYARVPIERIEESRSPEIADRFDYYNVPSVFLGDRKLFECAPGDSYEVIYNRLRTALDEALLA